MFTVSIAKAHTYTVQEYSTRVDCIFFQSLHRFLHQNLIRKIENLGHLQYLDTLNLSHNLVSRLENLRESHDGIT